MLRLRAFCLSRKPLLRLLAEARDIYARQLSPSLRIFRWNHGWSLSSLKPKRNFDAVILDAADKERLLRDAKEFLESQEWYTKRGVPWRRGYMFMGPPGSGKTSTVSALASELNVPVYTLPLASPDMSDHTLSLALSAVPERSILVIEDIDGATGPLKRTLDEDAMYIPELGGHLNAAGQLISAPPVSRRPSPITLSALLNAIDGCDSSDGRILIMTSNDLESLDSALIRPGRVDEVFRYKNATKAQAARLFEHFYSDHGDKPVEAVISADEAGDERDSREAALMRLRRMAIAFAECVEDHEFSMAALQGMLLEHKKDPEAALAIVPSLIEQARLSNALDKARSEEKDRRKNKALELWQQRMKGRPNGSPAPPGLAERGRPPVRLVSPAPASAASSRAASSSSSRCNSP